MIVAQHPPLAVGSRVLGFHWPWFTGYPLEAHTCSPTCRSPAPKPRLLEASVTVKSTCTTLYQNNALLSVRTTLYLGVSLCHLHAAESHMQGLCCSTTGLSEQQSPTTGLLHVALSGMQVAQTDTQVYKVVRTLAVALGATRAETGTIKALHAVLMQLVRPEMGDTEAYTSTGASRSNFTKWKRRVLVHAFPLPESPQPSRPPSSLASPR